MKQIQNERGNAALYLIWLLGVIFLIFIIVINIVKVYVVKEQANTAVEQAAFAGTSVLIEKTKASIRTFDQSGSEESILQREIDGMSIESLLNETITQYSNLDSLDAFVKAANEILPSRISSYSGLKREFLSSFSDISHTVSPTVYTIIQENESNTEDVEIYFSREYWRLEIQSTVTFETISDRKWMPAFQEDILQKGYGPSLHYIESVFN